jgi:hypothetical protein
MQLIRWPLTRILDFIVESGNPWSGENMFSGAALWCTPITKEGFQSTVRYTLDQTRLKVEQLIGKMPGGSIAPMDFADVRSK